jgi:hypothetical protein
MGIFGRAKKVPTTGDGMAQRDHASNPNYLEGVEPAGSARSSMRDGYWRPQSGVQDRPANYVPANHPAVVTNGFDDCGVPNADIHYSFKTQPDVGGALNYAYDNYALPLRQPGGAFMVARSPFRPFGSIPMQAWQIAVPTGIGLIPGQIYSQPLINPQGPDTGIDIYS